MWLSCSNNFGSLRFNSVIISLLFTVIYLFFIRTKCLRNTGGYINSTQTILSVSKSVHYHLIGKTSQNREIKRLN